MKIYEIQHIGHDYEPMYVPTRKEAEELTKDGDSYIRELEFEYNKQSICHLCSIVAR